MPATNRADRRANGAGTAKAVPAPPRVSMRFSAVPLIERIELEILNPDNENGDDPTEPETIWREFLAYPKGDRCPVWVEMEVQAAFDEWRAATCDPSRATADNPRGFEFDPKAELELRRSLLRATIQGLDIREASVLAADGGPWDTILDKLGWHTKTTDNAEEVESEEDEEDENPEAMAVSLTEK